MTRIGYGTAALTAQAAITGAVGRMGATVSLAVCLALVLPTLAGGGLEGVRRWVTLGMAGARRVSRGLAGF